MSQTRQVSRRLTWRASSPLILGELSALVAFLLALGLLGLQRTAVPFVVWALLSLWVQGRGPHQVGLFLPPNWKLMLVVGPMLGILLAIPYHVGLPLLRDWLQEPRALAVPTPPDDPLPFLGLVLSIWLLGALSEEFFFRGYLMLRLSDLFGSTRVAVGGELVIAALIFTLAHELNGLASMLGILTVGVIDGALYLLSRRNLLLPILFHGTWDTILILLAWFKL